MKTVEQQSLQAIHRPRELLIQESTALSNHVRSLLMALEGIGPVGALLLYATMGSWTAFSSGREFAAYLGLAPKQYSSGGKTTIVGLSKKIGNSRLRSVLILGDGDPGNRVSTSNATTDGCLERPANRDHVSDRDICSGETYTPLRPQSPLTLKRTGVRLHSGPGDSVST